jgi:hypothetical protein
LNLVDDIQSCAKNRTLIRTYHYIEQMERRHNNIVPDDDGIHHLMATQVPVYIEKRDGDKFKLFYNIDLEYDLIVVISYKTASPIKIALVTVHQQEIKRRLGNSDSYY